MPEKPVPRALPRAAHRFRATPSLFCLIPARGGSKRLARKNVALLDGRPLITYAIRTARDSGLFDDVYVSTEDPEIAAVARGSGASVLSRPAALAADHVGVVDVALHAVETFRGQGRTVDVLCVIYATAALLEPQDLRGAWDLFQARRANAVFGVTRYHEHPLWALREAGALLRPAFPSTLRRRQALPEFWVDAGYFYFIKPDVLRRRRTFYVSRLAGYPIPRLRAVDIDEPEDLRLAELLFHEAGRTRA